MYRLAQFGLLTLAACFLFAVIMISAGMMVAFHNGATQQLAALALGWLLTAGAVAACFWKSRQLKIRQEDVSPLPVSTGPMVLPVQKAGVAVLAGIGILLLWLLGAMVLSKSQVDYAFLISLVVAIAIVVPMVLKIFTATYYLRIDQSGLHHYRFGDIPWSDVSGIRIGSVTVKGSTKYHLMVMVKRPAHYAERMNSWLMFIHRKTLLERHTLAFPLQMASGNPAHVFEAAVRFRSAVSPPALTGWDGNRETLAPLSRWVQSNPFTVGMAPEAASMSQRMASTLAASFGGWTYLDTPEMAAKRAEMNALVQARAEFAVARAEKAFAQSPPPDVAAGTALLQAASREAEDEFSRTADGRRLAELQTQMKTQVAASVRRQRWQVAVVVIVILALYIGAKLLGS